ncbi:MAG: spinster family MFS transporter [Nevskiaceae bacterium]
MQNSPQPVPASGSLAYPWFVVAILMVAYVVSFVDRQILNLLVGPIRRDLGISDTQMSLLMGFTFAVFYTVMGIPLGKLADSRSRRGLIAVGVLVWSVMTALCGTAKLYWHLLLARIGVGVGEAALSPAAYSMIADYFPPEKRATAISVYSMGIYVGSGLAFLVGGLVIQFVSAQGAIVLPLVGETRPWQVVFFVLGGAGILFSAAFLLVREPPRQGVKAGESPATLRELWDYLKTNRRTVLCHNLGFSAIAFCSYGTGAWIPTFFIRTFGWTPGEIGLVYGLIAMFAGSIGVVCGGRLADHWQRQGIADGSLRVGVWAAALLVPFSVLYLLMPTGTLAATLMVPLVFLVAMPFGAAPAAIQDVFPNRLRGQASAIYLFLVNLIGLGLGPTAVALITDFVFHDDMAVRYSMIIVGCSACAVAALVLAAGLKPYCASVASLRAAQGNVN